MLLVSLLSALLLPACSGSKDCGDGFTLHDDGNCYADTPADTASADTDTDTDSDTDTDTDSDTDTDTDTDTDVSPVSVTLSGTLTINGTFDSSLAICTVLMYGGDQLTTGNSVQPLEGETPRATTDLSFACPTTDGGSVTWSLPDAVTGGQTTVGVFGFIEPDADITTHDAQQVGLTSNPLTVENGGTYPDLALSITLTAAP